MRAPTDGSTHWSARRLARKLGLNHMQVTRAWARAGIQPHRRQSYVASDDPDYEAKALDIIGIYINPPQHSIVFSVDEKTAIPGQPGRRATARTPDPRHPTVLVMRGIRLAPVSSGAV